MRRPRLFTGRSPTAVTAVIFGGFLFLGISLMLARGFSATGSERAKVVDLVRAQARGDTEGVLGQLPDCRKVPACVGSVRARAARVRRDGEVKILQYRPSVQIALVSEKGTGRVAWRAGDSLPVVQCVRVRRDGALDGGRVTILSIGPPLGGEASCR